MGQFSARAITVPDAFARSITRWKGQGFELVMKRVETNLSGKMLKKRSGATLANVRRQSGLLPLGFRISTTHPPLIARLRGSRRKGFFVAPVKASVLTWVKGGQRFFSKGHYIPPWTFPVVPVFDDAINASKKGLEELLRVEMVKAMNELFPDVRLRVG